VFSGYGNDLSIRLFGGKAYLSWIFGGVLLIAFLGCGTTFRGLQSKIGKCWIALVVCLLFSSAFSIWRSESVGLLENYVPKILFVYFYCCAFSLTLRNLRILIIGNIICTTAILLSAALFGKADDGNRFAIPDSLFFGNPNDLALALVCSLGFTVFLILQKSILARILGIAEFLITLFFVLKTGSRGGFLALAACLTVWIIFSSARMRLIALAIPAMSLVALLPGSILIRLVQIAAPGADTPAAAMDGTSQASKALGSQYERTRLLERSIGYAFAHPVFGLGPGTFMDALYNDDVLYGTHTTALGTHNTYTQLASECGFPVLFLYLGVLFGSIAVNYRIMKRTRKEPGAEKVFTISLCLLGSLVAFAIGSAFHHVAYSLTLPVLSAMSVALHMSSQGGNLQWIDAETAAGNV
jgi:hypothetical protein